MRGALASEYLVQLFSGTGISAGAVRRSQLRGLAYSRRLNVAHTAQHPGWNIMSLVDAGVQGIGAAGGCDQRAGVTCPRRGTSVCPRPMAVCTPGLWPYVPPAHGRPGVGRPPGVFVSGHPLAFTHHEYVAVARAESFAVVPLRNSVLKPLPPDGTKMERHC